MALNADVLAALMKANMDALSDADKADRNKTLKALASAVVTHLQTAAVVPVVTTCPAGGGTGAGTIT